MKSHEEIASRVFSRRDAYEKERRRRMRRILPVAVSATLAVAILMSLWLYPPVPPHTADPNETTTDGSGRVLWQDNRTPNNKNTIMNMERAYIFPWKYKTDSERYPSLSFGGKEYSTRGMQISAELLDTAIGRGTAMGYDVYEELPHTAFPALYRIEGIDPSRLVAVNFGENDTCYVYHSHSENAPATLGDFIDAYALTETLTLSWYEDCTSAIYVTTYCKLTDETVSERILELLFACRSAPYRAYGGDHPGMKRISFSVSSEVLGIENRSLRVTEDGYLWTNLADYGYAYFIGEEAAREIIEYAKKNSVEATWNPNSESYLVGKLVETGDGYVKLDDSIMMKDPKDGLVFTVLLKDFKVRRYIDSGYLKVGDTVRITYDGKIYGGDALTVETVYAIDEAIITNDGNALIPE